MLAVGLAEDMFRDGGLRKPPHNMFTNISPLGGSLVADASWFGNALKRFRL
jgi:hypothetical protein